VDDARPMAAPDSPSASKRRRALGRAAAICAALAAAVSVLTPALAATDGATVVPVDQRVQGRTYAQWEAAWWRRATRIPTTDSSVGSCSRAQHGRVWLLDNGGSITSKDHFSQTCSMPAATDLFLGVPSFDCSTVEKRPFFARTDAQLVRCARRLWRHGAAKATLTLDGVPVEPPGSPVGTPAFTIALPRHNILGARKRRGRAAVYGLGLMLDPLEPGTHTLVRTERFPGKAKLTNTYRITVG
jgi:hypothetical protein